MLDAGYFMMPAAQWGTASSPILYKDRVVVQCDVQKDAFLAAFDAKTGKEIWRTPRAEVPTWSTPTIYMKDGKPTIAVNGWKHIGGDDFATGKEVWKLKVAAIFLSRRGHRARAHFITNAHGMMAPVYAVKCSATGDIPLQGDKTTNDAHRVELPAQWR